MFQDAKCKVVSATALYNTNTTLTEIAGGSAASAFDLFAARSLGGADTIWLTIHVTADTTYSAGSNTGGVYFAVVNKATVDVSTGATEIARFLLATADLAPGKVHCFPVSTKQALRYLGILVAPVTAAATTAATVTVWWSIEPETALQ